MITQFNASNLITPYYNQCCIENKLFKTTFSKLSLWQQKFFFFY